MEICICDDEKKLRRSLRNAVETELQLCGVSYTIKEFSSGEELLSALPSSEPDILFLDIEMDGISGMETAHRLREKCRKTVIIFVTAYPDYVFQGYEVHAFHYILKPYREEKIREVLRLALEETERLDNRYFLIEQKSRSLKIPLKDILYFRSDRKKVSAVTNDCTYEFYGKLTDIETGLPEYFLRIHNRYLVNLRHVTDLGASSCICGGEELPASRPYRHDLAAAFAKAMLNG
ncbi:MAG TPA: LytTR family DNA-binding domain-containing protein [Candidatus Mediterraneibacter norfolkensis]|nr:LytTR family DNA-binding domain-containing protein [Candidatus Mediterraneibacter norfolkensis]